MTDKQKAPSLAVLIDADNTSPDYAEAVFEEIAGIGEANVRRIYGDFTGSRLKGWDSATQSFALLQQQQRNNTTGKNAADIALVIDAMDLMHRGALDGFCLVSSDSDFTRLAQRLREAGMMVYGFGERKTPEAFRVACHRFIYVENLVERPEIDATAATKPFVTSPGATDSVQKLPASQAAELIQKAMAGITSEDGWAELAGVGSRILNIAPDFDPRSYGHAKLSALVEDTGGFDVHRNGGSVQIRPKRSKNQAAD